MATIKSYTDIEQSRKLAEILPLESADMYFSKYDIIHAATLYSSCDGEYFKIHEYIPCWSLAALVNAYPMTIGRDSNMYYCWQGNELLSSRHYDNPVDACYEMILKLHEFGLL